MQRAAASPPRARRKRRRRRLCSRGLGRHQRVPLMGRGFNGKTPPPQSPSQSRCQHEARRTVQREEAPPRHLWILSSRPAIGGGGEAAKQGAPVPQQGALEPQCRWVPRSSAGTLWSPSRRTRHACRQRAVDATYRVRPSNPWEGRPRSRHQVRAHGAPPCWGARRLGTKPGTSLPASGMTHVRVARTDS